MNEKREKQKEEEKVNKDRKMRSETIILRPEVPLLERLSTYAASDAYPFHMPGHKRQVKMGITSVPNPFSVDITEIDGFDNLHHAEDILKESMNSAAAVYGADRSWYLVNGSTCGILAAIAAGGEAGGKNPHGSKFPQIGVSRGDFKPAGTGIFISGGGAGVSDSGRDRARAGGTSTFGASGDPGGVCDFPDL